MPIMRTLLLIAVGIAAIYGYPSIRTVDSSAVTSALNSLVALDTRTDSGVKLSYQNMASHKDFTHDNAANPLFTSVDASILNGATYKSLQSLLTFYTTPDTNTAEVMTPTWNASISSFLDIVIATPVMKSAQQFLVAQNLAGADATTFKNQLYTLWFQLYARSAVVGSSGFESVFAGEVTSNSVIGFNNWVNFYLQEAHGTNTLNYHGWFSKQNGIQIDLQFAWGSYQAMEQSMLLNSSPEFEFAAYTVCAYTGGDCTMTIAGNAVQLHVNTLQQNGVTVIDTCYPSISGSATGTTKKSSGTTKKATPKPSNDPALQTLVNNMRDQDVDKPAPTDYVLNWGNKVSGSKDTSPNPLFTSLNEAVLKRPVYSVLNDIYTAGYFTPDVCTTESSISGAKKTALQNALDTWTNTKVFQLAFNYLNQKGIKEASSMATFKAFLFNFWYGTYSRCSGHNGSSGWEHVFSGEWKSGTVDGQHNWMRYYQLEKANQINYHGYFSYDGQLTGTFQYTWETEMKQEGGFLFGTSPAFDFSLLTVCSLAHSGAKACVFTLDGYPLAVTSYTQTCATGTCLSTAYPTN